MKENGTGQEETVVVLRVERRKGKRKNLSTAEIVELARRRGSQRGKGCEPSAEWEVVGIAEPRVGKGKEP